MKLLRISLIIGLILSLILLATPSLAADHGNGQNFGYERILVKFKAGTDEITKHEIPRRHGDSVEGDIAKIGVTVVKIPAGKMQEKLLAYQSEKTVQFAEPDFIAKAIGTPNDSYFGSQWGMTKIQAPKAWDITTGSTINEAIKIAILDTGADQDHVDLAGKIVDNKNFTSSSTVDDLYGHGTHVAGIAAAATNNGIGVAGVGYDCTIMNVKVLDDTGSGYYSWIASGIIYAADNGAKVISMSLGGSSSSSTLQSAVDYAWSKGVVIVAAAGNNGNTARVYPGYYTNVIAVAATNQNDVKASWSSYGSWVDVAAPGVSIFSTVPNHSNYLQQQGYFSYDYGSLSGTSMATPFVAGLAGLVWATPYGTSNTSVRSRIESTADPVTGTGTYWQYGRINAYKAVAPPDTTPPAQVSGLTVTAVSSSQLNLSWTANTEPDLKNYRVYRSTVSDGPRTLIASPTVNYYLDTGLASATTYYYVVSAVDTSGNEGLKSAEASGTTSEANKMHVASITMALKKVGQYTYARATITTVDAAGKPVAQARVSGHWSGATNDSDTGQTNSSGQVTVQSNSVRRPPSGTTFTFTVDNVTLSGWVYDSAANVETSDFIKVP
jgi:thermitase